MGRQIFKGRLNHKDGNMIIQLQSRFKGTNFRYVGPDQKSFIKCVTMDE